MANDMPSGEALPGNLPLNQLQEENRRLEAQVNAQAIELNLLRARFARYETALRGSQVVVYTQDRSLRYTSISQPMLGHSIADLLGRADEDVLPESVRESVLAIKREAVSTGQSQRLEFSLEEGGALRWYDLHIEALRNDAGDIVGITCASVDVTERKEGEAHLRLLLRELTHRSKNLLAVIQAMARQTARHAGSIDSFLTQFAARLQALAASHDLLIRESWYGASLNELVRSQLSGYLDGVAQRISIEGPDITLKPEAAQNLGLALHELSANAVRFGALSIPDGQVSIEWRRDDAPNAPVEFFWRETQGPRVKPRRKRGFGTMVIETNLTRALDAKIDMIFDPDGLRCQVEIPASQVIKTLDRNGTSPPESR
ncbi:HWE histidine kinase domain-containing protein [Pseudolabrys sp. FHR47]|uniref:HWE histidine kinase domain-containing protein n=1 Tax=Pseudolabrys sp. FHR47 TaxID=2562284 RepID=UPI0010BF2217|nr:HWE histidine kinase domain-containing protein [Pseudolabrys sp. FHR47]